jgi:hypothetical protein
MGVIKSAVECQRLSRLVRSLAATNNYFSIRIPSEFHRNSSRPKRAQFFLPKLSLRYANNWRRAKVHVFPLCPVLVSLSLLTITFYYIVMLVFIHLNIYTYIFIHIYKSIYIHTYIYIYIYVCVCVSVSFFFFFFFFVLIRGVVNYVFSCSFLFLVFIR